VLPDLDGGGAVCPECPPDPDTGVRPLLEDHNEHWDLAWMVAVPEEWRRYKRDISDYLVTRQHVPRRKVQREIPELVEHLQAMAGQAYVMPANRRPMPAGRGL
jgi:hypothetical protein